MIKSETAGIAVEIIKQFTYRVEIRNTKSVVMQKQQKYNN